MVIPIILAGAVVRQENSYYPFGMIMPGSYLPSSANKNLYNAGSEWQDDFNNLPDYYSTFYRNYDAAIGRFIAVDPRAEATESLTSYHYGLNNPVMNNDPNGDISQTAWNNMLRLVERGLNNMDEDGYVFNENTGDNGTPLFRQGDKIGYYQNTGIEFFRSDRSGITDANGVYTGNSQYTWAFIPLGLSSLTQRNTNQERAGIGLGDASNTLYLMNTINTLANENALRNIRALKSGGAYWMKLTGKYSKSINRAMEANKFTKVLTESIGKKLFVVGVLLSTASVINDPSASNIALNLLDTSIGYAAMTIPGMQIPALIYFTGRIAYDVYKAYNEP